MFELADYLVGIYKVEDCTQSVTIQNYDKQRVMGLGEKESEKENQDENQNQDSLCSRASQSTLKENQTFDSQAVGADDVSLNA
jgi:hypothetical protein